jgi:phosphoglycolate phosphatase
MQRYDTIIFDLDGTLLDTLEDLADSVNFAMALYGYPPRTISEVRNFVGNGVARLIELSIPGGAQNSDFSNCLEEFRRHYAMNMQNKTKPYNGIMELLNELAGRAYRIAVVSNKFDKAVKALCNAYFGEFISVAIGESERVSKKPAPDTVFEALGELDSSPDRAIYVGDSEVDAETAINSGIRFVGATWGFRDRSVLEQAGVECIDKPAELLAVLCEVL